jgi:AbiU2
MQKVKKRRRKRVLLVRAEAIDRLERIVAVLEKDVRIALLAEAVLEAGNEAVQSLGSSKGMHVNTYDTIHRSLGLDLAISLSRVFDSGSKRYSKNEKDAASIPQLVHFLKQSRCQKVLVNRSRSWTGTFLSDEHAKSCRRAIDSSLSIFSKATRDPKFRKAMRHLKSFRDFRLAHSLLGESKVPKYNDLFSLMDVARDLVQHAQLAINGQDSSLEDYERIYREDANGFWRKTLSTLTANKSPPP